MRGGKSQMPKANKSFELILARHIHRVRLIVHVIAIVVVAIVVVFVVVVVVLSSK